MLTKEETEALANVADTIEGEIIGEWFDDTVGISSKKILAKDGGNYVLHTFYKTGPGKPKFLEASDTTGGTRLDYDNDHGEYLFLSSQGDLSVRSSSGFDFKYRKASN